MGRAGLVFCVLGQSSREGCGVDPIMFGSLIKGLYALKQIGLAGKVNPSLYSGSTDLRIFTEWTSEKGMGCYNTLCQGFVLANVSGAPVPGEKVSPLSTFNGKDYFITLSIKKDEKTQDWSLYRDDNSNQILIGWWPKSLFNNTFDYATTIAWAGSVMYRKNETSPRMGSGHAACEGANKAAYISNIKVYDKFGQTGDPDETEVREFTDRDDCFTTCGFTFSQGIGYNFYYGGPSGCIN
ncbi:protein neprosin-like [Carex rostrata]